MFLLTSYIWSTLRFDLLNLSPFRSNSTCSGLISISSSLYHIKLCWCNSISGLPWIVALFFVMIARSILLGLVQNESHLTFLESLLSSVNGQKYTDGMKKKVWQEREMFLFGCVNFYQIRAKYSFDSCTEMLSLSFLVLSIDLFSWCTFVCCRCWFPSRRE